MRNCLQPGFKISNTLYLNSICFRGKWECTGDAKCPSTCVIHGEGHVTTFDGKQYVFDGSCEYTLVQVPDKDFS